MAENQFPVELETYLADGQAAAREQEAKLEAQRAEKKAKALAAATKIFDERVASARAAGVPDAALRYAVRPEIRGEQYERSDEIELRIPACAPIIIWQDKLHDYVTDVESIGAPYYRVPSDVDDDGEGNVYWSAYSVQEFSDFEDALAFAHQRYPRLAAFEARMAESAARYEAMKQAKAAAEAEQAEHEDNIRKMLMETEIDPIDDSTANYLHCIDDRLTAIGMILYDLVLAVRQKGA